MATITYNLKSSTRDEDATVVQDSSAKLVKEFVPNVQNNDNLPGSEEVVRRRIRKEKVVNDDDECGQEGFLSLPYDPPFTTIGFMTFKRTYARRINAEDPNSDVESWSQTLNRVISASDTQLNAGFTESEKKELYYLLYNLKCSVAGRFLWQLGSNTVKRLGLLSLQNCAYTDISHPIRPFTWAFDALMLGSGVGYSVEKEHVDNIPPVKHLVGSITRLDANDADFIVPDSREGWIGLLGKVLKAYFYSGRGFTYSCHLVRGKGVPIKSFGGVASGPAAFCKGLEQIGDLLGKAAGRKITPNECLDVMCIIGSIVVSGNVRRCIPHDSYINTKEGMVKIEEVNVGDMVLTRKGFRRITNKFYQGYQSTIRIVTEDGEVECTEQHKLAVKSKLLNDSVCWKKAGNIKVGDTFISNTLAVPGARKSCMRNINTLLKIARDPTMTRVPDWVLKEPFKMRNLYEIEIRQRNPELVFVNARDALSMKRLCASNGRPMKMVKKEYATLYGLIDSFADPSVLRIIQGRNRVQTYDIEVEGEHEFFCEGILMHNSAQIALGDARDLDYIMAKRWDKGNIPNYRAFSNNTVRCDDINDLPEEFWEGYNGNGEPYGLFNRKLARSCGRVGETQYPDHGVSGTNPCSEQTLENKEVCCLAEIFLPNLVSKTEFFKCIKYLHRMCKRSLLLPCHLPETQEVVRRNMRIGIGITGYLQASQEQRNWLSDGYNYLREVDNVYSDNNNIPRSIKLSTVKPSGTLSLLGNCTSGIHPAYSRYYIRRVRFSSNSPLLSILEKKGYRTEYVRGFDGKDQTDTKIVEFPCRTPDGTLLAKDCSAVEQLEVVSNVNKIWSDNAVSVTVYYRKHELPAIKRWLLKNYTNNLKAVSFLLHNEHGFDQAPLEEITKERFEKLNAKCTPIRSLGSRFNKGDEEIVLDSSCVGGMCPVR